MRVLSLMALVLVPAVDIAAAGPAANPAEATAFIRVVGRLQGEYEQAWKHRFETGEVEIGTGTGFVVSPAGYLLTSRHVVTNEGFSARVGDVDVRATLEDETIEVYLPGTASGAGPQRYEATLVAEDEESDLAVLSIPAADLPYVPLGDSDAIESAANVRALGFPFGGSVEVARTGGGPPHVTVSAGNVAALRAGDDGHIRYVQTDATLNPGNSGGPIVDADGYAVGLVRMKLRDGEGIGFAVAINVVKDWLESRSLDQFLPVRRLRLGAQEPMRWKRVRMRLPEGLADHGPSRLQVDGRTEDGIALTVDRVATAITAAEVETHLRAGRGFGNAPVETAGQTRGAHLGGRPALLGSGRGRDPRSGVPWRMEYAVLDLGNEKLVARYLGPAEAVAFNLGAIRDSLASLEADPLLTSEVRAPLQAGFAAGRLPAPDAPSLPLPATWVAEAVAPYPCRRLRAPDSALSASPEGDYTVTFRVAWWKTAPASPEQAAQLCTIDPAAAPPRFVAGRERLSVMYSTDGVFLPLGGGLLRLEAEAPEGKRRLVRDLFAAWVRAARPSPPAPPAPQ